MLNQNSNGNRKSILIFLLIDIILFPSLLFGFLSLPRFYASLTFADWNELFNSSYIDLNLNLVYLLVAVFFVCKQFFYRLSKSVFLIVILLLLMIRIADVEMIRLFQFSFSPAFFANMEVEALKVALAEYWMVSILLPFFLAGFFLIFLKLKFTPYGKRDRILLFILIFTRSAVILVKQSWHSSVDFATQLLIEQAHAYYLQTDFLKSINWSESELETVANLGFEMKPAMVDAKAESLKKRNIFIIYLEGFQANYTEIGGSLHKNLSPNLDLLREKICNYSARVTPKVWYFRKRMNPSMELLEAIPGFQVLAQSIAIQLKHHTFGASLIFSF